MTLRSTMRRAVFVLTAATAIGAGVPTFAFARDVQALLVDQNPNTPAGTNYMTSNNDFVYAQTDGYTNQGIPNCIARGYGNGIFSTSKCDTSAISFQSFVRTVGTTFCSSPQMSMPSLWWAPTNVVVCSTPSIPLCPSNAGCYVNVSFYGYGFGHF